MDCGGQFFPWQRMKRGIYVKGTPSIHPPTPLCFGGRNNGNVDKRNLPKKFKPLEGGQFRFWSNLKVPFMYTCGINHFFRIFNPTFDEWKSRFGVQSSQKRDLKNRKNEKMPQNSQFWACFDVFEQPNLFCLNFAIAVELYFAHFLQMKMVTKLKSREIAWNQVFSVQNAVFHQITKFFGGKCARNKKLDKKRIEI